jgi:hypothetical protein
MMVNTDNDGHHGAGGSNRPILSCVNNKNALMGGELARLTRLRSHFHTASADAGRKKLSLHDGATQEHASSIPVPAAFSKQGQQENSIRVSFY